MGSYRWNAKGVSYRLMAARRQGGNWHPQVGNYKLTATVQVQLQVDNKTLTAKGWKTQLDRQAHVQVNSHMWILHVNTTCEHYMWTLHVNTACEHYMWTLHVNTTCEHYVYAATCKDYMWTLHVNTTCGHYMWAATNRHIQIDTDIGTATDAQLQVDSFNCNK
jgi:hypothetical protein